jgi:hypothetical protein
VKGDNMSKCVLVRERDGTYEIQPNAELKDWDSVSWGADRIEHIEDGVRSSAAVGAGENGDGGDFRGRRSEATCLYNSRKQRKPAVTGGAETILEQGLVRAIERSDPIEWVII